jgi:Kef-type K+ transport system membrane component KefB
MTQEQRVAAATISLVLVAVAVAAMVLFAANAVLGALNAGTALGDQYLRLVFAMQEASSIVAPLGVIMTAGLAAGAALGCRKAYTYGAAALLFLGVSASLALWLLLSNPQTAADVVDGLIPSVPPRDFISANSTLMKWTLGAFAAGLGAVLGVTKLQGSK